MNRVIFHRRPDETFVRSNLPHRPGKQLRLETEATLRDMGYVLELTRRIKEQLLEEKDAVCSRS